MESFGNILEIPQESDEENKARQRDRTSQPINEEIIEEQLNQEPCS